MGRDFQCCPRRITSVHLWTKHSKQNCGNTKWLLYLVCLNPLSPEFQTCPLVAVCVQASGVTPDVPIGLLGEAVRAYVLDPHHSEVFQGWSRVWSDSCCEVATQMFETWIQFFLKHISTCTTWSIPLFSNHFILKTFFYLAILISFAQI